MKTALEMLLGEYQKIFTPDHKIKPEIAKHLPESQHVRKKVRFADDPPASSLPKATPPQTIYTALDSSPFLPTTEYSSAKDLLALLVAAFWAQKNMGRLKGLIQPFFILTKGAGAKNVIGQFLTIIFKKEISPEDLKFKTYPVLDEIFTDTAFIDSDGLNKVFLI